MAELLAARAGDQPLFTTADAIERLWEISAPLLDNQLPSSRMPPAAGASSQHWTTSPPPTTGIYAAPGHPGAVDARLPLAGGPARADGLPPGGSCGAVACHSARAFTVRGPATGRDSDAATT